MLLGATRHLRFHALLTMHTQVEFEALLDRYLAGTSSPSEQQLVENWYQQLGQDEPTPLGEAEQQASQEASWSRIQSQVVARAAKPAY